LFIAPLIGSWYDFKKDRDSDAFFPIRVLSSSALRREVVASSPAMIGIKKASISELGVYTTIGVCRSERTNCCGSSEAEKRIEEAFVGRGITRTKALAPPPIVSPRYSAV
jgi:hypothetical protein